MSYSVSAEHALAVSALSAGDRYKYTIKKVADWKELWSLRNAEGWVTYTDPSGRECVPIWPHAVFAQQCAVHRWADTAPEFIDLQSWLTRWIPGLTRDNRGVAVFPSERDNGVVVDPPMLKLNLQEELSKISDE